MDTTTLAATRILRFLEREPVVWLSTVRPDGTPHLVPIWFTWDGEALVIFSKPDAQKVRNVEANASVMLALGDVDDDFDVGLIEARAELIDLPAADVLANHLDKYADRMASIGLSATDYGATYSQAIRIVPVDFLDWHGRTTPRNVRIAGAPAASLTEPTRERRVAETGEPMSRRRPALKPRIVNPARVRVTTPSRLADPFTRRLRTLTDGIGTTRPLPVGSL